MSEEKGMKTAIVTDSNSEISEVEAELPLSVEGEPAVLASRHGRARVFVKHFCLPPCMDFVSVCVFLFFLTS